MIQIVGPFFVMALLITAPESPRWLAKKGRHEEARAVLVKHHANGDDEDPLVEWQFGEMLSALQAEAKVGQASYVSPSQSRADLRWTFSRRPETASASGSIVSWVLHRTGSGTGSSLSKSRLGCADDSYLAPVLRTVGITAPDVILSINVGYGESL